MKIGVTFPQTEIGPDPGGIREFVQAAEELDFAHLVVYDHVLGADPSVRPGWSGFYDKSHMFHEPMVLYGFLAAVTQRIELNTAVLILGQRQTVLVAKQAAEVDVLTGGRLRLGIGTGWNPVEYEALNEDFHTRGARCEEQIEVLRALWTQEVVTFEGRWHKIAAAGINPLPVQRPIPIWIGGGPGSAGTSSAAGSDRVLKRIARMADGWFPSVGLESGVQDAVARLHEYVRAEGRDPSEVGIEGSVSVADGTPDSWVRQVHGWKEAGATHISVDTADAGFSSVDQHADALRRFKEAAATCLALLRASARTVATSPRCTAIRARPILAQVVK